MGLMPDTFEDMTWTNFQRLLIYHHKKEAMMWDKTRVLLSYILNVNVEKKNQKKPSQILPLWTDKIDRLRKIEKLKQMPKITQEDKESMLKQVGK
jgi:hypothetical protein